MSVSLSGLSIGFVVGDIAEQACDGVVNAANARLLPGSGVCGAIFSKAGKELPGACEDILAALGRPLNVSEAAVTPGFGLKARWIIHAVAPRCMQHWDEQIRLQMEATYRSILDAADRYDIASIAIPAMGLGVYQCDPGKSTECVLNVVRDYARRPDRKVRSITFVLHSGRLLRLYEDIFAAAGKN